MLRTTVLSAYNAASCSTLSCTSAANCSSAYVWSRQASSSSKGSTLESTNRPRQATPSSSSGTYTPSSAAPTQSSPDLPPSPATAPPEPKYTTSQTQFSSEQDKLPLPWLDRPLGVKEKPLKGGVQRTRSERIDAYLTSGRGEERKRIVQSAAQGYFHDFHSLRSHGGKTWRAPNTLIRQDRALYFPAMEGTRLSNKESTNTVDMMEGRVSVVAILNSRVSEEHTKSFYEPALDHYSSNPKFQLIQINMQPNLLKHYLISLFMSSLRTKIPAPLHQGYLLSKVDVDSPKASGIHREDLNLHNKHVGYTYLVGPEGKIRWAGCGFAEREEREALFNCVGVLLGRGKGQ